jgi:hypothetical protein
VEENKGGWGAALVLVLLVGGVLWLCSLGLRKDPEPPETTYRQTDQNGTEWEVSVRRRSAPR